ncbi:MarR family winged helix-turn-helix transcriptional regulator [Actinomycetospora endophytica]|uniref:MarR family winged helix-turn-helix transcriptional regulator n=1 Tax=Actinomycetospora endophytica TaxID=2291215 RepID=A0ABS8P8D0_9PSEU|nr:MarR family winged helix-turn-helix transcriptional regulator [Actinomycetospora endophytica]MCD2193661.1 MarR family winged helix-turn-helix transcriptional regulator [Actinomycetospora endophytica]
MGRRGHAPGIRVVDLLDLADRTVGSCLARASVTAGISREQWRILMLLDEGVGEAGLASPGHTMGQIAARAAVPAPTATRLVDRLVAEGLAYRRSDDWDRRRVHVHISPEGHALVTRAAGELDDAFGAAPGGLGEPDRLELWRLLDRLSAPAAHEDRTSVS